MYMHVWYIYMHFVDYYGIKCYDAYTILWVMNVIPVGVSEILVVGYSRSKSSLFLPGETNLLLFSEKRKRPTEAHAIRNRLRRLAVMTYMSHSKECEARNSKHFRKYILRYKSMVKYQCTYFLQFM